MQELRASVADVRIERPWRTVVSAPVTVSLATALTSQMVSAQDVASCACPTSALPKQGRSAGLAMSSSAGVVGRGFRHNGTRVGLVSQPSRPGAGLSAVLGAAAAAPGCPAAGPVLVDFLRAAVAGDGPV